MNELIITGDDGDCTFVVYDLQTKSLKFKKEKQPELESTLVNQGRPTFRPFGISVYQDKIYIASNDRIGVFDKNDYNFNGLLDVVAFINTHQILMDGEYFYICNTATDSIGIYNLKTKQNKFLKLPEGIFLDAIETPFDAYAHDRVHINSLYKLDDMLFFCLHNKKEDSKFGFLNLTNNNLRLLFSGGSCAHNIRIIDNKLYTLSTQTGEIIQHNLRNGDRFAKKIVDPEQIFLRGLEVYNGRLLIACSSHYDIESRVTSHILEYDRVHLTAETIIQVPEIPYITDIHLV